MPLLRAAGPFSVSGQQPCRDSTDSPFLVSMPRLLGGGRHRLSVVGVHDAAGSSGSLLVRASNTALLVRPWCQCPELGTTMDSVPGEDPALPLDFSSSANISELQDIAEDEQSLISGSSEILGFADGLSIRARTMKDFENQITDLKKENFNLKLRIYFLEEQVQQKFDGASENIYKTNIELKVEVESLKHNLQEKQNLLIKASKAVESLAGDGGSKIESTREEAQKQVQQVEDILNRKIHQLEEALKTAQTDLEKVSARMDSEQKQSQMPTSNQEKPDVTARLTEKDAIIEQLKLALKSRGDQVKEAEAQTEPCDQSFIGDKIIELTDCLCKKDGEIESLQMQLKTKVEELDVEKKNGLKRDKTIQGLTLALKTKEKEEAKEAKLIGEKERINQLLLDIQKNKQELENLNNLLGIKEANVNELHGVIKEKDAELLKLSNELKNLQKVKDELEWSSACSLKEKDRVISQLQESLVRKNVVSEHKQEPEYEELIYTLKSEHHMYSKFMESVKKPDRNLKTELNTICVLRKQLEEDIKANHELRKILEEKIKMAKSTDDETLSFCWDQTAYLSICLGEKDHLNLEIENLSLLELRKKVRELLLLVQELQSDNRDRNRQCKNCNMSFEAENNENSLNKDMFIPSAYLGAIPDDGCLRKQTESPFSLKTTEKSIGRPEMDQLEDLTANKSLPTESGSLVFESRLEHMCLADYQSEGKDCKENVNEDLKTVIVQLRNELNHFKNENKTLKQEIASQTSFDEVENFHPNFQFIPMTSAVTTFNVEDNYNRPAGEEDQSVAEEQTSKGKHQGDDDQLPLQSKLFCSTNVTHKSPKKSRLPVPVKPSINATSQNLTTVSKKKFDQPQKDEPSKEHIPEHIIPEKKKKPLDGERNISEAMIENIKEISANKEVLLKGSEAKNYVDDPLVLTGNQNSQVCWKINVNTSSTDLNVSSTSLASFNTQHKDVQIDQDILKDRIKELQHELEINQSSSPQIIASPKEQEANRVTEHIPQYESELQKEKAENMKLLDQVSNLQRKMGELSPSRFDSLVQSQARELSFQRQQIRDGYSTCVVYHEHLINLIKAFEELLQASDVDYYVAEGFREQLNQSMQLVQTLEEKLCYGELSSDPEGTVLIESEHGYEQGIQNTYHLQQQLESEVPIPSACDNLSDSETIDNSYVASLENKQDTLERDHERKVLSPQRLSQDLLMEHLQEIRTLRHRLEDSIKTNDRLRKQLERQIAETELDHGSTNMYSDPTQQNTLISEINFLRRQNESLKDLLARGSRDKQKENEKLRESLLKKNFMVDHLHSEYESVKKENERLQKQLRESDEEIRRLMQEVCDGRNELNRLQSALKIQQNLLSDDKQVLQSLRIELQVYEKMREAKKIETDCGQSPLEECTKDQTKALDLHKLLSEIQSLRVQLERSIEANNALHRKLEEQISKENGDQEKGDSVIKMNNFFKGEWQHHVEKYDVNIDTEIPTEESSIHALQNRGIGTPSKGNTSEVKKVQHTHFQSATELMENGYNSTQCSGSSAVSLSTIPSNVAPVCHLLADKNGCHIFGLNEDYSALCKQISEGRKLLRKTEAHLDDIRSIHHRSSGSKVLDQGFLSNVCANISRVHQVLEEANSLSKLLWRVSLPTNIIHNTSNQDEEMKIEIIRLRKTISEQEKKLHCTSKRLHSINQIKENMEKIIIDQLALTHDVLKKARGNLESQPSESQQ